MKVDALKADSVDVMLATWAVGRYVLFGLYTVEGVILFTWRVSVVWPR